MTAHKCLHNMAPSYLADIVHVRSRDGRLRQNGGTMLHQPVPRRSIGEHSFGTAAAMYWNALPLGLNTVDSLASFKKCLKTHLLSAFLPDILMLLSWILKIVIIFVILSLELCIFISPSVWT